MISRFDETASVKMDEVDPENLRMSLKTVNHAPSLTNRALIKSIILGVIAVLSLIANVITIWSIKRHRKQNKYSAIYNLLLHLTIADLLVTLFCIGGESLWTSTVAWLWGNVSCKLFKFLQMFSLYLSTFILVLIGVDRFVAIRYPMKSLDTIRRFSKMIFVAWIASFLLSIPQLIVFHVARGPFIEDFSQCVTHGFYTEDWQEQLYGIVSLLFMFILPLIILAVTYISTVITISRNEKSFKSESKNTSNKIASDNNRRRLMHRAKMKSLRISIAIVTAFVICWTPYYTMMIIFMFLNPDEQLKEDLLNGIFFFGMSNSLVNPIIYGLFHLWPRKRSQKFHQRDRSTLRHRSSSQFSQCIRKKSTANFQPIDETLLITLVNQSNKSINNDNLIKVK